MPIYEFVCPSCGHAFERLVALSRAEDPQSCPVCGHERAKKQVSLAAGVIGGGGAAAGNGGGAACGPVG